MDVTQALTDYGQRMADELGSLCGYIFMQKSPSCGLERVKVYQDQGRPAELSGRGIHAQAFCSRHPDLPVEEDGRLNDPVLRENFLTRVFAYSAWQDVLRQGLSRRRLTDFHARYKYLLMAHNPEQYKTLGTLLGNMGQSDPAQIGPRYFSQLMAALKSAPPAVPTATYCNTSAAISSKPSAAKTNRKCSTSSASTDTASCRWWCR